MSALWETSEKDEDSLSHLLLDTGTRKLLPLTFTAIILGVEEASKLLILVRLLLSGKVEAVFRIVKRLLGLRGVWRAASQESSKELDVRGLTRSTIALARGESKQCEPGDDLIAKRLILRDKHIRKIRRDIEDCRKMCQHASKVRGQRNVRITLGDAGAPTCLSCSISRVS